MKSIVFKIAITLLVGMTSLHAQFTRDAVKETVADSTTGLMWQDDAAAASVHKRQAENNDTSGDTASGYCENLTLGGFGDWRLPNIDELQTIVDYNKSNPAISSVFLNSSPNYYWSSTVDAENINAGWDINFNSGYHEDKSSRDSQIHVRCVRSGNLNYTEDKILSLVHDNNKDIVHDQIKKLDWQDSSDIQITLSHSDAVNYCDNLIHEGYDNWRLPTLKELFSIADYKKYKSVINSQFQNNFANSQEHYTFLNYWSSTDFKSDIDYRWVMNDKHGFFYANHKYSSHHVRCVRNSIDIESFRFSFADNSTLISALESFDGNVSALNLLGTLSVSLSRAEAAYLLDLSLHASVPMWNIDLSDYPMTFGDVDEDSAYSQAVKRLSYYRGIDDQTVITRENALFNPLRPVSRQEFLKMVLQGFNLPYASSSASLSAFSDTADIAAWAVPYFQYAVDKEIIVGNGTQLLPAENITRDEALNILRRTFNAINGTYAHSASGFDDVNETIGLSKEISDILLDTSMPDMTATPIIINNVITGAGTERRTLAATLTSDTAKGATPYCYWYTDWGYLEKSTSANNQSVYFHPALIQPAEDYLVTVQCYDGLGFYDEKTLTLSASNFSYTTSESGNHTLNAGTWPSSLYANRETIVPLTAMGTKDGLSLGVEYIKVVMSYSGVAETVFEGRPMGGNIMFTAPENTTWYGQNVTLSITAQFNNGAISTATKTAMLIPDYRINGQLVLSEANASLDVIVNPTNQKVKIDNEGYFSVELPDASQYTLSAECQPPTTVGFDMKTVTLTPTEPKAGVVLFQNDRSGTTTTFTPTTQQSGAITSPSDGATLISGTSATITWNLAQLSGDSVKVFRLADDANGLILDNTILSQRNWYLVADNLANSGSFAFNPTILGSTNSIQTKILIISNTGNWSVSNGLITYSGSGSTASDVSVQMKQGWNLTASFYNFDPAMVTNNPLLDIIWHYKNGLWYAVSPVNTQVQEQLSNNSIPKLTSLETGDGYWLKSGNNGSINTFAPFSILTNTKLTNLVFGWSMLGTGENVTPAQIKAIRNSITIIWVYRDGEWYTDYIGNTSSTIKQLSMINAGEGFWVYNPPPPSGTLAHYSFDNNVNDQYQQANFSSDGSNEVYSTGILGAAIDLAGTKFYSNTLSGNLNEGFSISLWVKTNSYYPDNLGGVAKIFSILPKDTSMSSSSDLGIDVYYPSHSEWKFALSISSDNGTHYEVYPSNEAEIKLQTWYHIVYTVSSKGVVRDWYNGNEGIGATISNPKFINWDLSQYKFQIGSVSEGVNFDGSIDDVQIFHRVLTPSEISVLSKKGSI